MAEDYCELCDLPLSTCVHGMPPAPPEPARASPVRTTRVPGTRAPAEPRPASASASSAGASGASSRSRAAAPSPAPSRPARVTPVEAFRPHVLVVLRDAGGSIDADDVMEALGARMDDVLLERDRTVAPTGEVRWQTSARKARKAMIDEGLVVPASPGTWQLTPAGAAQADALPPTPTADPDLDDDLAGDEPAEDEQV